MSILSNLFKKSIHGDSFNKSYKDEDNNTNSIDCSELLNEKEIFLLHYLYGRKIAWKIDDPVKSLFKDFDKELSYLFEEAYLQEDEYSFFLQQMNIKALKAVLKKLSLSLSGNKEILINRILENSTPEERKSICSDQYYVLSEKGLALNSKFIKDRKAKEECLKEKFIKAVEQNNFESAALFMAQEYSTRIIPPGIGIDWADTDQVKSMSKKELNQIKSFDFSDLLNTDFFVNRLVQIMYYDNMIEHNLWNSIEIFLLREKEAINCPSLEAYFKQKEFNPTEEQRIYTYLVTKRYNTYQLNMGKMLKDTNYKPLPSGEYLISDSEISLWKDLNEFHELSGKNIDNFPKTFATFQKHKAKKDDKYLSWIIK